MSDTTLDWRDSPRYAEKKAETLRRLQHAIEQVEKDQHLNAQGAMTDALRASQACFGVIRHGEESVFPAHNTAPRPEFLLRNNDTAEIHNLGPMYSGPDEYVYRKLQSEGLTYSWTLLKAVAGKT